MPCRPASWPSGVHILNSEVPRINPLPKIWFNSPDPTGTLCQAEVLGTNMQDRNHLNREGQEAGVLIDFKLQAAAGSHGNRAEPGKRQCLRG